MSAPDLTQLLSLTIAVVADCLQVSERSVWRYIENGELPAYKPSPSRTRVRVVDLEAFMNARRVPVERSTTRARSAIVQRPAPWKRGEA